ncbi:MAG TPA: hypothetical protein VHX88_10075 [Solirubrobacteraceae bacterium]|nr:hypothetical protein [Solirubrobacteraceae bacterium]
MPRQGASGAAGDGPGAPGIRLCGELRVADREGERSAERLARPQPRQLLALLALRRTRPGHREELAEPLWPDACEMLTELRRPVPIERFALGGLPLEEVQRLVSIARSEQAAADPAAGDTDGRLAAARGSRWSCSSRSPMPARTPHAARRARGGGRRQGRGRVRPRRRAVGARGGARAGRAPIGTARRPTRWSVLSPICGEKPDKFAPAPPRHGPGPLAGLAAPMTALGTAVQRLVSAGRRR